MDRNSIIIKHLNKYELSNLNVCNICNEGVSVKFVLGFISPTLNLNEVSMMLKSKFERDVKIILTTTAGELCSGRQLYIDANDDRESIVLQIFTDEIINQVDVLTVKLFKDITDRDQKVERIKQEINSINVPRNLDYNRTLAFTLIDGLSGAESFYMEALYATGRLPYLSIGGSAGGFLDFKNT